MSNPLLELIGSGEGNYNSYNRGTTRDENGKAKIIPANQAVDFSQMTVGEIQRRQSLAKDDHDVMFAVGKHQLIPGTLKGAVDSLGIDPSEKFSPELQDKIFNEYLLPHKRPDIQGYITGKDGVTLRDAQKAVCLEWASVEDPDTPGHAYAAYEARGNKMHTTAAEVASALDEMRSHYQANIAKGLSAKDAWRATASMGAGSFEHAAHRHAQPSGSVLRPGNHGPAVGELQTRLAGLGYTDINGSPLAADNDFGPSTKAAVEAFQRDHNLKADGIAGPDTFKALEEQTKALAQASKSSYEWSCPGLLDDPAHPDNAFYLKTRDLVYQLDQQNGRMPDQRSNQLASALTVSARAAGLHRIDQVALSEDASALWGAQRPPGARDHFFDQHCKVDTVQALSTPMEQSGAQWPQAMQHFQEQQQAEARQQQQVQQQEQASQQASPSMAR